MGPGKENIIEVLDGSKFGKSGIVSSHSLLIAIIFLSLIPYASALYWVEAIFCALIFTAVLNNLLFNRPPDTAGNRHELLLPFYALGCYSLLQGAFTLLLEGESNYIPESFEASLSIWSAVKIFAVAGFLKLLIDLAGRNIRILLWGLIAAGNAIAFLGIFRFVLQNRFPETFRYFLFEQLTPGTGFATFTNQNHFAFLMLMTIGLNVSLLWWGKLGLLQNFLLAFLGILSVTALILTGSRGGIISSFGVFAFIVFFARRNPGRIRRGNSRSGIVRDSLFSLRRLGVFAVVSVVLILAIFYIGQDRVITRFEQLPSQVEVIESNPSFRRIDVYKATWEMIKENPVFGVGFGGFRYAVSQYVDISGNIIPEQAHNDYLEFAASGGIIATLIGLWALIILIVRVNRGFQDRTHALSTAARIAAISGLVGVSIHSLFDFSLQNFANLLFLSGLIALAVHIPKNFKMDDAVEDTASAIPSKQLIERLSCAFFVLVFAGYSLVFAFSRFDSQRSDHVFPSWLSIPFDAEIFARRSAKFVRAGNNEEALVSLQKAIKYRPFDFALWEKVGQLQQSANQIEQAEESLHRAIELAPNYGSPLYHYGRLLINKGEIREGYSYLRNAFRRDPQFFYDVANIAWGETNGDGAKTIELLSPLLDHEAAMLNMFFFEEGVYSPIVDLTCKNNELPQEHHNILARRLLEKREYYNAFKVYRRICSDSEEFETVFENGDFLNGEINDRVGFGWRSNNLPPTVSFQIRPSASENNLPGLDVTFAGNSDPKHPLLTQLLIVEHNQKYRIEFRYRSTELITGGVPLILLIPKSKATDGQITEIELLPDSSGWRTEKAEFLASKIDEAIEVRLIRRSCGVEFCPIFGRLELTDFKISKL